MNINISTEYMQDIVSIVIICNSFPVYLGKKTAWLSQADNEVLKELSYQA